MSSATQPAAHPADADAPESPDADVIRRSWRMTVLAIAGSGVALRLLALVLTNRPPRGLHDPTLYRGFGEQIADGRGYLALLGTETAYYPPGYPYFLGAVQWVSKGLGLGDHLNLTSGVVQAVLGGCAVWAVMDLGRTLFDVRRAVVAGVLFALWPNLVLHSATMLSETLFLAVFMAALAGGARLLCDPPIRPVTVVATGVFFGASVLVRPQALLVLVAIGVVVLAYREIRVRGIVALAGVGLLMALVMTPWWVRNAGVFDGFVPLSTNGGDNLCIGFHPDAPGHFAAPDFCETGEFYVDGPDAEYRRNHENTRTAIDWATSNLGEMPRLALAKIRYTYENDTDALAALESYGSGDPFAPAIHRTLSLVSNSYYWIVLGLAVVGTAACASRWWRDRRGELAMAYLLAVTAAGAVVPILFFGDTRFKVPVTGCYALLAAAGGCLIWDTVRDRRSTTPDPDVLTPGADGGDG